MTVQYTATKFGPRMNKPEQTIDPDTQLRLRQAEDSVTSPDILQKLAADSNVTVREKVAHNAAAPLKAQVLLALDDSDSIRAAIAYRAGSLVARLAQLGAPHAAALAIHTLEALALDQAVNVRVALATSLKDVALAPAAVIKKLARDISREVAEPILRCCLALSDDDLISLISERRDGWRHNAIASRASVSAKVSDAIIASDSQTAVMTLLGNAHADLDENRLTLLTDRAVTEAAWQEPLARRAGLPPRLARRLAEFVDEKILGILRQRDDFDSATVEDIVTTIRRRVAWTNAPDATLPGAEKARRMFLCGTLDTTQISDALSWNEQDFVSHAVALLARVPVPTVTTIFKSQNPRAVTALAWRAKLPMRCALLLQMRAANIPSDRLLNARGGTEYPETPFAMIWQLEMYGIVAR